MTGNSVLVLAADPLLGGDIGLVEVLLVVAKAVVAFVALLVAVMLMIWFERKLISRMHQRIGPTIAGPWGILQTLADGIKLFFKEDLIPDRSDRFVFKLAPYLSLIPAFLAFAVIPLGGDFNNAAGQVEWWGRSTYLQVADPPVGILLFLAMSSLAVYGVMLAGWSSGSKYPLLGSVRASAQMISYEAALGLTVASIVLMTGSLSTHDMVLTQAGEGYLGLVPRWNLIVTGLVPFIIFVIAGTAELNRPPFDLVEAEQELVGGFHTEYSSIRFALFFLAEFMNTITMSAVMVTLFLGGPAGPVLVSGVAGVGVAWVWGFVWFFVKLFVLLCCFVWVRATLPRFRYDQLMDLGWKTLTPVALGWLLFLAALEVGRDQGWNLGVVTTVSLAGFGMAALMLFQAVRRGRSTREAEAASATMLTGTRPLNESHAMGASTRSGLK